MTLRVVGAGLPRTGTTSLKAALERLLGARCYHMMEVFGHPEHVPIWHDAIVGGSPDWDALLDGYDAAIDWPASAFVEDLATASPDAVVVLSTREDSEAWWRSADRTVFEALRRGTRPGSEAWQAMALDLARLRFSEGWDDRDTAVAAYEDHNARVRDRLGDRVVEWQPDDGWGPLCRALGVDEPAEPFPHSNTAADFRSRAGWD